MRIRTISLVIAILLLAGFVALNVDEFTRTSILSLGFTLTLLGATSAIAAPHTPSPQIAVSKAAQPAIVNVNTVGKDQPAKLYVAENRPEFGSKYQRY